MISTDLHPDKTPVSENLQTDIDRIWKKQQACKRVIRRTSAEDRVAKLNKISTWLKDNREKIIQALQADFRKPVEEIDLTEIWVVQLELKHARRHLKRWMRPKPVRRTLPTLTGKSWIQYEPMGVVLIISPWNYPLNLTLGPLASAIAAGNCVMIKPSEFTPNASCLIHDMIRELFPEEEIAVIEGDHRVAMALQEKPFDHIFFTGSPDTGKKVMRAAAEHLSSVTLELGGKSPAIIDETARLGDAAKKIIYGKFLNSGQTCIAPDYLIVQDSVHDEFVRLLGMEINRMFGATREDRQATPDFGRIVHQKHMKKLTEVLNAARSAGAECRAGGESVVENNWMSPTILTGVTPDNPIMREELFGPLLPVIPYSTLDEAIKIIQTISKPLALYVFSQDKKSIKKVLTETSAGGTCINDVVMHFLQMNLPFGGVNHSGIGKGHGVYGFEAFSNQRAVFRQSRYNPILLILPPYNRVKRQILKLIVKYL